MGCHCNDPGAGGIWSCDGIPLANLAMWKTSPVWGAAFLYPRVSMYLEQALEALYLLLGLSGHAVGMAELDLHLVEVTLHLLLHPQGLVAAARLCVQGGLQRVHHPQVVALGLLHLLVLLGQLPLNLCLDLVELQLGPEDLALLMLQGGLVGAEGRDRGSEAESKGIAWGREGG